MNWKTLTADSSTLQSIENIANSLSSCPKLRQESVFGGDSGISLFWFYYYQVTNKSQAIEKGSAILEETVGNIGTSPLQYTYCNGLAGLGWLLAHLKQQQFISLDENIFEEVDTTLCAAMHIFLQQGNYDYLHGSLGIANYLLHQLPNPEIENSLAQLIDLLVQQNKSAVSHYVYWTSVLNPVREANETEAIGINISLSHGLSSIAVILAKFYQRGIAKEKVESLLNGILNFLWESCLNPTDSISCFPNHIKENEKPATPSRLAWCYGDVGMGIALWQVAKTIGNEAYQQKAIAVLLHSTKRTNSKENFVYDAGLCHGSTGLLQIYNRMYQYTGKEEFKEAALYWLAITIEKATFADGLAGYKKFSPKTNEWETEYGILEGIAGIGLALMAATSEIEPAWDEMLLLSSPF